MKKQIDPRLKSYKDARDGKILQIIAPTGLLGIGFWMVISPAKPKHSSVEKATVSVVKDLWGMEAGLVFLALGVLWIFFAIRGYLRFKRTVIRPE